MRPRSSSLATARPARRGPPRPGSARPARPPSPPGGSAASAPGWPGPPPRRPPRRRPRCRRSPRSRPGPRPSPAAACWISNGAGLAAGAAVAGPVRAYRPAAERPEQARRSAGSPRPAWAAVISPRPMPDWFVTTPSRHARRRSRAMAAAAPGIGSTSSGSAVVGHVADQGPVPVEQHRRGRRRPGRRPPVPPPAAHPVPDRQRRDQHAGD